MSILLELPITIVQRARMSRSRPAKNAVEIEGMIAVFLLEFTSLASVCFSHLFSTGDQGMNLFSSWRTAIWTFLVFYAAFSVFIQCGKGKKKGKGKAKKGKAGSKKHFVKQTKTSRAPPPLPPPVEVPPPSTQGSNVPESDLGTRTNSISADSQDSKEHPLPPPPPQPKLAKKAVVVPSKVEKVNKQQSGQKSSTQPSEAFYEKCDDLTPAPLLNLCALQDYKKV
uniref:Uncharacterized protein n=1 Tax=Ditylenchus dipsaci TaxID=166011 RepID=A0A915ES69_9BILA